MIRLLDVHDKVDIPVDPDAVTEEQAERRGRKPKTEAQKKAQPFDVDTVAMQRALMWGALAVILSAFILTYAGTVQAARWMMPQPDGLIFFFPFVVEAIIVWFSAVKLVMQQRKKKTRAITWLIVLFSGVAVVGNVAHTYDAWEAAGGLTWQGSVGIGLASVSPLVVVIMLHWLGKVFFKDTKVEKVEA